MAMRDIAGDISREYLTTHPWITFRLDLEKAPWRFWNHVGEAHSKCRHLARTPLPPFMAQAMERVYLAKGARASAAIEGNSLNEQQAVAAVEGNLEEVVPFAVEVCGGGPGVMVTQRRRWECPPGSWCE
jgi:hypothetical protein